MITTSLLWLVVFFGTSPVSLHQGEPLEFNTRTGWYNGAIVRYVPFAASDSLVAKELSYFTSFDDDTQPVDWAPALSAVLGVDAFNDIYFINSLQTAIFSVNTASNLYTPLWRVIVLEWKRGAVKTPLISEADVLAAIAADKMVIVRPFSILDATIVQDVDGKIIPQAVDFEFETGEVSPEIELPSFLIYSPLSQTRRVARVRQMLITDVSDQALATQLGANYAPRLVNVVAPLCSPVYAFVDPAPASQFPLVDQVQDYRLLDGLQINKNYNPIKCWTLFSRGALPIPSVVNNIPYANALASSGVISEIPGVPIVTNSPVGVADK